MSVSGADPLNLAGILTPGPKLASLAGNRVLYRDGIPLAFLEGNSTRFLEPSSRRSRTGRGSRCMVTRSRLPIYHAYGASLSSKRRTPQPKNAPSPAVLLPDVFRIASMFK